jgi:hypothetical protein
MIGPEILKTMNSLSKEEFEKYRETWKSEWYDHWRLLDIDFEAYMLMKGLTKQEFKNLNSELWQNT